MIEVIILAGGKGKRMQSDLPKPLHPVGGVPAINRILAAVLPLSKEPIIVIGDHSRAIIDATGNKFHYVLQSEQNGTGHAVLMVRDALKEYQFEDNIMVIPGDHPLVSRETLEGLFKAHIKARAKITITTLTVPDFKGDYETFSHAGRIVRDGNRNIRAIVEFKDANDAELAITEVNVSYYCFNTQWLWDNIHNLTNRNAAQELYLTDMIRHAVRQDLTVHSFPLEDFREAIGFNTPEELAFIERLL